MDELSNPTVWIIGILITALGVALAGAALYAVGMTLMLTAVHVIDFTIFVFDKYRTIIIKLSKAAILGLVLYVAYKYAFCVIFTFILLGFGIRKGGEPGRDPGLE